MKSILYTSLRIILCLVLSFIVLSLICLPYYSMPLSCADPDGATDYRYQPNDWWFRATEGYGYGRTNNDGYMNQEGYDPKLPVDILVTGSSQMEAMQVATSQNTASLLGEKMAYQKVYNIGISGHTFLICAGHLERALEKYHPEDYVIMETDTVSFSDEDMIRVINGTREDATITEGGLYDYLRNNPYLRLLINQIKSIGGQSDDVEESEYSSGSEEIMDEMLGKLHGIASDKHTKLVIFYHPTVVVEKDGSVQLSGSEKEVECFRRLCDQNDILFLDMGDRFLAEYKKDYTLPYGFWNTSVGSGHLNRYGHEMIADELYKLIGGDD